MTAVEATNASVARNLVYPSDNTNDDLSIPKPTFDQAFGTVWQCTDTPDKLQVNFSDLKRTESDVAAFAARNSLAALSNSGAGSGDCSGIAVVNDDAYQTVHDVTLAVIGVLLTFGATLIFSGALFGRRG